VQRVLEKEPSSGDWSQIRTHEPEPRTEEPALASPVAPSPLAPPAAPILPFADPEPYAYAAPEVDDGLAASDLGGIMDIPDIGGFAAVPSYEPDEPQPVPAVAPLVEVQVEEPARSSRTLLFALIVVLILVGIVIFFFLFRRPQAGSPPAEQPAPATRPAAPAVVPQTPAPTPAPSTATKSPGLSQDELERMVKDEMARREQSIRRTKEAEIEKYKKEIERMQAAARKKKEAADAAANEGEPPPQP
jgi:flagellar basal body-associated protein FliL